MSIKKWPGAVVSDTPVVPAGPFQDGTASGVWTLDQVAYWQKQGLWPVAGNVLELGFFMSGDNTVTNLLTIDRITISTKASF